MIDDRTAHFSFALPHPTNSLDQDVLRLREAISGADGMFNWCQVRIGELAHVVRTKVASITYDGAGRVASLVETLIDLATRTTIYAYDGNGLVTTETVVQDGWQRVTTYSYSAGRLAGWTTVETPV